MSDRIKKMIRVSALRFDGFIGGLGVRPAQAGCPQIARPGRRLQEHNKASMDPEPKNNLDSSKIILHPQGKKK